MAGIKNITIKLPMTIAGLEATRYLAKKGVKTNVTLIFTVNQALLAARAGATYVSPFLVALMIFQKTAYSLWLKLPSCSAFKILTLKSLRLL